MLREFIPKLIVCLQEGYSWASFKKDLVAGITVGVIALPLAMAFAIASGVPPEKGLFTAIVAGFLISLLGGSRAQIGGPTGAFVVLVYTIIERSGYEGLALATLIASALLILLAVFRLGSWIKYIPHPLIIGFTTGLAVCIFSTQIKDFFGLKMESVPVGFVDKWEAYFKAFPQFDPTALALGSTTLIAILFIRRYAPKVPWGIAAIALATLASFLLDLPVETIQSKFGMIPQKLPSPSFPSLAIPLNRIGEVLIDAIAIACLGGIESLLSCLIADRMMGTRHRSNTELLGQGIANIASVLFGGIPATGAIARTAANVKSGAQTPIAGMIHALTLLAIMLFCAPLVSRIPLPALAAVLIVVAWNMSEAHNFLKMCRAPAADVVILVAAFFLTILVDITASIGVGMILASFIFMKKMSDHFKVSPSTQSLSSIPLGVEVFEIHGPFFFGTADKLKDMHDASPQTFILGLKNVPFIDASGMHALREFKERCERQNIPLLFAGAEKHLIESLKKFAHIREDQIVSDLPTALGKAEEFTHLR